MRTDAAVIPAAGWTELPRHFTNAQGKETEALFVCVSFVCVPAEPLERDAGDVFVYTVPFGFCFPWHHPRLAPHTDGGSVVQHQQEVWFIASVKSFVFLLEVKNVPFLATSILFLFVRCNFCNSYCSEEPQSYLCALLSLTDTAIFLHWTFFCLAADFAEI